MQTNLQQDDLMALRKSWAEREANPSQLHRTVQLSHMASSCIRSRDQLRGFSDLRFGFGGVIWGQDWYYVYVCAHAYELEKKGVARYVLEAGLDHDVDS